jgi:tetraacyldisaccharide 4'-kinase
MAGRVEAFFLREWQHASAWQILLQPLSWLYRGLIVLRDMAYTRGYFRAERIDVPVIVVGNITVGGTGKTPIVLALSQWLATHGARPGIVTRGYTRTSAAHRPPESVIQVVTPAHACSATFSDEALLLAERSGRPVFVGAKRAQVAQGLRKKFPETNVIVCDDGLQHYRLKRDVEIAVVDGTRGFGNGHCLPAGPLREPVERLRDVDCIVLNNPNIDGHLQANLPETARQSLSLRSSLASFNVPIFDMTYQQARLSKLHNSDAGHASGELSPDAFVEAVAGKRVVAIAGIGNPERFFAHVRRLGIALHDAVAFPDHHVYQLQDLGRVTADIILMTEKDAVKCREFVGVDDRLWIMRVDAALPDAFFEFVLKKIDHVARP